MLSLLPTQTSERASTANPKKKINTKNLTPDMRQTRRRRATNCLGESLRSFSLEFRHQHSIYQGIIQHRIKFLIDNLIFFLPECGWHYSNN